MTGNVTLNQVKMEQQYDLVHQLDTLINFDDSEQNNCLSLSNPPCNYYSPGDTLALAESLLSDHDKSKYSVFSLNCRGLKAHIDDLKTLISHISSPKFQFDVIGLTEIFSISDNLNTDLQGYGNFIFKNRQADDVNRGGVGIYIEDHFNFKQRSDLSIFIPHIIETIFVEIRHGNNKPIIIGCIYRPNSPPKADLDIFVNTISEVINLIKSENKEVILMGDLNIDLLKYNTHNKTNSFINGIFSGGLLPLITKPTRICDSTATLIDHILTNITSLDHVSGITITDISDHFGVFAIFKNKTKKYATELKFYRSFKEENIQNFSNMLRNVDFSPVYTTTDVNDSYNPFLSLY